jgi:hypothetical protein
MLDPFYATLKLVTGEEVLAEVIPSSEEGVDYFLVQSPIVISETMSIDHQKGVAVSGLVPKKWMLYGNDDMTIIYKHHVISISELDKFGTDFYSKALIAAKVSSPVKRKVESENNVGYIGKIESTRLLLEDIYSSSPSVSDDDYIEYDDPLA